MYRFFTFIANVFHRDVKKTKTKLKRTGHPTKISFSLLNLGSEALCIFYAYNLTQPRVTYSYLVGTKLNKPCDCPESFLKRREKYK